MPRRARASFLFVLTLLQFLALSLSFPVPASGDPPRSQRHAASPARPALPVVTGDARLDHAESVALSVLAANQVGPVHRAAPFYAMPWIRDSFAWGMIPDDRGTLKVFATSELQYWLARQQSFGGWITFQYSGWYDETAILIAAVLDAYRLTGDVSMVRRALPRLRRGWAWLRGSYIDPTHGSGCLLWATVRPRGKHWATDWADQVARQGYTPQLEGLWYRATFAMAALEHVAGSAKAARDYTRDATCISRDVNRLLWDVDSPTHRNAPPLARFGHYRAQSPDNRDNYFEIDGNALLISLGIPNPIRRHRVLGVIMDNQGYLLGERGPSPPGPARVVYGDYEPRDYGPIHNWMADGQYQSAYWPSVGGLLAIAAARNDATTTSLTILRGLAARNQDAGSAFHEWYRADGTPSGAASYAWGARMYVLALYRAYLGVDDPADPTSAASAADLVLRAAPGPSRGEIVRLGHRITVIGHGKGAFRYARLDGRIIHSFVIPARLLHDGSVLDVYRGQ